MNISSLSASCVAASTATSSTSAVSSTGTDAVSDSSGSASHHHHVHRGGGGHLRNAVSEALQSADPSAATSTASKQDTGDFMHALFEAVKAESPSSAGGAPSDAKAGFASGLSALITDLGNGSAPADLQDAFSKVAPGAAPAALQSFLSALQQNLGYGHSTGSAGAAAGNTISTQA